MLRSRTKAMESFRTHGSPPFRVAVVHGGPGAAGEMAPVARRLSSAHGVLEPLQTAVTLDGQVEELCRVLRRHATAPVTLVGHSWGAWLVVILAARHLELPRKLILVASGPFEDRWVAGIDATRAQRLSLREGAEYLSIVDSLRRNSPGAETLLPRLGELAARADTFVPLEVDPPLDPQAPQASLTRVYAGVWPEAARLRSSGELLRLAGLVTCPVVALHGEHDPHPVAGVQEPLARVVRGFRMVVLERCGHTPWRERHAAERFFKLLQEEIGPVEAG